jgi:hypothetical protein
MIPKPYNDDFDYNPFIDDLIEQRLFATEYPDLEDIKDWPQEPSYKEPEDADDLRDVL